MRIAVAASGNSFSGMIPERFSMSKYLLIIDIDEETLSSDIVKSIKIKGDDIVKEILNENCELVISGILDREMFDFLADNQITRYDGTGLCVREAIEKLNGYKLDMYTHAENEISCSEKVRIKEKIEEELKWEKSRPMKIRFLKK